MAGINSGSIPDGARQQWQDRRNKMLIYTLQCAALMAAIGSIPFAAVTAVGWLARKGA